MKKRTRLLLIVAGGALAVACLIATIVGRSITDGDPNLAGTQAWMFWTAVIACGVTGVNRAQGTPLNPAAPDRCPGGSGSGRSGVDRRSRTRLGRGPRGARTVVPRAERPHRAGPR